MTARACQAFSELIFSEKKREIKLYVGDITISAAVRWTALQTFPRAKESVSLILSDSARGRGPAG